MKYVIVTSLLLLLSADYCESSVAKSTSQSKSQIIATVDEAMPLGGMTSERAGSVHDPDPEAHPGDPFQHLSV